MGDPSKFDRLNVADTCSIWNVLASRVLHTAAKSARVSFCITEFVRYECLFKPSPVLPERIELQKRLRAELQAGTVTAYNIEIEDLQDAEVLQRRARASRGELSSMIFAKKTRQAFMTDDEKAAKLARTVVSNDKIQSTPHLLGWLYFTEQLCDADKEVICSQLEALNRNLRSQLESLT